MTRRRQDEIANILGWRLVAVIVLVFILAGLTTMVTGWLWSG